jgi:hypothetical protein
MIAEGEASSAGCTNLTDVRFKNVAEIVHDGERYIPRLELRRRHGQASI